MVLRIPFFTLSNADIQFTRKKLIWTSYIIDEGLPTTKRIEIIDKKKLNKTALDNNVEAFLIYVTSLASI